MKEKPVRAHISDDALIAIGNLVLTEDEFDGLLIDSRYRVRSRLGRGGMGEVYRATDTRLGRDIALKMIVARHDEPDLAPRFLREMRALTWLDHPGIVPIYDFGSLPDGRLYYTMKLVVGSTLEARAEAHATLSEKLRILADACDILEYAHSRGVVHRDLKPSNVMAGDDGRVYLLDWGIAKAIGNAFQNAGPGFEVETTLTRTGAMLGTLAYMAPEQARGEIDRIGPHTDVYSLGAMLYEMITGQHPVEGASTAEAHRAAVRGQPVPVRALNPNAPYDLELICLRAMNFDVRNRHASAGEFGADLRAYLSGRPIRSPSKRAPGRVSRALAAHPALLVAVGAILGAALVWLGWHLSR